MNKLEAKTKRLELLKQIDVLDKERCEVCSGENVDKGTRCMCPTAVEIRKLGAAYENIATEARKGRLERLFREGRKNGLTLDLYHALREMEQTNEKIFKGLRMNERAFFDWKYEMGLIKERREPRNVEKMRHSRKKKADKPREKHIEQKYIDIAEINGINYTNLYRRVFVEGWELKRAISEPIQAKQNDYQKWAPIAEQNGVSFRTLKGRVERGEAIEKAAVRPVRKKRKVMA